MADKRINYHNKTRSLKRKPSQTMIKAQLKTIKDINCNFPAINRRERERKTEGERVGMFFGSPLFPNPVIYCLSVITFNVSTL